MDSPFTYVRIWGMESDPDAMSQLGTYDADIAFAQSQLGMYKVFRRVALKGLRLRSLPVITYTIILQRMEVQRLKAIRRDFVMKYTADKERRAREL